MLLNARRNVQNMLKLWLLYGATPMNNLWVSNSWPHRVWHDSLDPSVTLATLADIELAKQQRVTMIQDDNPLPAAWLEGFQQDMCLQLMDLDLSNRVFSRCTNTELKTLSSDSVAQIDEFSALCSDGFGYEIDTQVLKRVASLTQVELMLLTVDGKSVATALIHATQKLLGIYQIAVPEEHRGKGYATSLMLHILNFAQHNGYRRACLQASKMGQNLYLRLGFTVSGQLALYQPK